MYTFLAAIGAVFCATAAGVTAFCAACCATCFGLIALEGDVSGQAADSLILIAGLVGMLVAGGVLFLFWKRPRHSRRIPG